MTESHTPERIFCGADSPASMYLLEAISDSGDDWEGRLFPDGIKDGHADVVLLVNGKQVPFKSVAEGFFERGLADLDSRLVARAKKLITAGGLEALREKLDDAYLRIEVALDRTAWEIENALETHFKPDEDR